MSEFIPVTKDGEVIEVHPDALADHKRLGWKVVEDEPVAAETPAQESSEADGSKPETARERRAREKAERAAAETPAQDDDSVG